MISKTIIQAFAQKQQTTELNIRREYVQHLLLSYFYQQKQAAQIFFKGGTALRIIYHSPRFSEDLDFSASFPYVNMKMQQTLIDDAVIQTLTEIKREGIEGEILEAKKTTGGYLATIRFALGEEQVSIQLEISFRDSDKTGELVTIASDFLPPYTLMQLSEEQLMAEKVQALLSRQKPRDFYDVYFLLRANLLPPTEKQQLNEIRTLLTKSQGNFEQELKAFLPKSHWEIIRDFKHSLLREVERFI